QTEGTWRYTLTDGDRVLQAGPLRRRPTASLRRLIEAKNRRCVFPGCRTPSSDCDIDHRIEYQHGGTTTEDNLTPLCRKDHRLKSTGRWTYQPTDDGDYLWTSPLGIKHTKSGRSP
ncbi:MAG: HNH endonuclease signature motif containing protein, partial [Acidimicrobiia bacterium]